MDEVSARDEATMPRHHRQGPAWVDAFLAGDYFASCTRHVTGKNEKNHFCADCSEGPLCQFGLAPHAANGHRTLQVRKASHMDAIRVVDVARLLEVGDIQTYSINSAKIVFLLSRPQPRPSKGAPHACLWCGRALPDALRFCSLACKLDVLRDPRSDESITLALDETHGEDAATWQASSPPAPLAPLLNPNGRKRKTGRSKRRRTIVARQAGEGEGLGAMEDEDEDEDGLPSTPEKSEAVAAGVSAVSRSRQKSRKGVPQRAPLR